MKIPARVLRHKDGSGRTYVKRVRGGLTYEPLRGESIDVLYWHRWPAYDFIFGVPAKGSKHYRREAAFFQYRDTRKKRTEAGFYVDSAELRVLARGFSELARRSK